MICLSVYYDLICQSLGPLRWHSGHIDQHDGLPYDLYYSNSGRVVVMAALTSYRTVRWSRFGHVWPLSSFRARMVLSVIAWCTTTYDGIMVYYHVGQPYTPYDGTMVYYHIGQRQNPYYGLP